MLLSKHMGLFVSKYVFRFSLSEMCEETIHFIDSVHLVCSGHPSEIILIHWIRAKETLLMIIYYYYYYYTVIIITITTVEKSWAA